MPPPTMKCSKRGLYRIADMIFLGLVFLFQNVVLNYIIIYHHSQSFFSFLWFLGDFFCLILFSFAVFLAHTYHRKNKEREQRSASRASYTSGNGGSNPRSSTPQGSESSEDSGIYLQAGLLGVNKLPLTYMSWLFYAFLLIMKITVLFKSNISQRLPPDSFLGPQMLKFCIGLSTIVFSLLVECHHNAVGDHYRNAYLNSVAFGVALEILDSVSFLSLLIPAESHFTYSFNMENYIIALASVNLMLPAVTIYKLSASNFGRFYHVPLETLYKVVHLSLVNLPFFIFRIYLWQMFSTDSAIFLIKNLYAIIGFLRGIYPDIKSLRQVMNDRTRMANALAQKGGGGTAPAKNGSNGHIPGASSDMRVVFRSATTSDPNPSSTAAFANPSGQMQFKPKPLTPLDVIEI